MLPESEDRPPPCSENAVRSGIPVGIGLELRLPPLGVPLRNAQVFRARVPEATVYEHRDLSGLPSDVDSEFLVGERPEVDAIADAVCMQDSAYSHLAPGVSALLTPHVPSNDVR